MVHDGIENPLQYFVPLRKFFLMNEFDMKAAGWDSNPMHTERSKAVAAHIKELIPLSKNMHALEFGAGTGTTSLFLADSLGSITMIDSSPMMVERIKKKISESLIPGLRAFCLDIEKQEFDLKFDLIFTQMVLHHVTDTESIILKFGNLLNPGGYIAIADLYPEDGSFHGSEFAGHKGFDPESLGMMLQRHRFGNIVHRKCFTIEKETGERGNARFDIFILTAQLKD